MPLDPRTYKEFHIVRTRQPIRVWRPAVDGRSSEERKYAVSTSKMLPWGRGEPTYQAILLDMQFDCKLLHIALTVSVDSQACFFSVKNLEIPYLPPL